MIIRLSCICNSVNTKWFICWFVLLYMVISMQETLVYRICYRVDFKYYLVRVHHINFNHVHIVHLLQLRSNFLVAAMLWFPLEAYNVAAFVGSSSSICSNTQLQTGERTNAAFHYYFLVVSVVFAKLSRVKKQRTRTEWIILWWNDLLQRTMRCEE